MVGEVVGVSMIQSEPLKTVSVGEHGERILHTDADVYKRLILVVFRPPGFLGKFMAAAMNKNNIAAGPPEDFTNLSGDNIYMNGMTFAPELYGLFFLSHHWQDRNIIDETIKDTVHRYTLQEVLKDTASIVDDAIAASPRHQKEQQKQNVQQIPVSALQPK